MSARRRRSRAEAHPAPLPALALLAPATASADPGFSCRGTGARIELAGNPQTLFTAGGGGVPCQADSSALTAADGPNLGLDANVLRADTATPATASSRVSGLHLANPAVRADEGSTRRRPPAA